MAAIRSALVSTRPSLPTNIKLSDVILSYAAASPLAAAAYSVIIFLTSASMAAVFTGAAVFAALALLAGLLALVFAAGASQDTKTSDAVMSTAQVEKNLSIGY